MEKKGFKEINIQDITKNVSPIFLRSYLVNSYLYVIEFMKRTLGSTGEKDKIKNDFDSHFTWISFLTGILGLTGIIRIYAITAIKK